MVLGMPWLARHDPVIDWTKRTIVHFGSSGATVSDGPVGAARAPRGDATHQERQCDARLSPVTPRGHRRLRESSGENVSRIRRLRFDRIREVLEASRVARSCRLLVSTHKFDKRSQSLIRTVTRTRQLRELMRLAQTSKGAPPSGVEVKKARRLWEPTLQAVRTFANVPHRKCLRARVQPGCTKKRYAIKQGLIACARGKNPPATTRNALRARMQPGCTKKRYVIKPGMIACARGLNPPAINRKICPRPGLDKTRSAEPGSALEANGASEPSCASLGQGPRRYSQCLPGRHRNWRRLSRH
ncbi:hypothetical protein PF001_g30550 [Phytophthora fragariae]|uniref:Uncharacterized protein n=1 Tax=Phytophthora fragariae TaxID=53985 RepID=A0A6A4B372_9STRA|nr:hypothetical protein PF003_g12653 [Phytophthora fragariae]KAE9266266.1 hypothetical protein PF001_g30550 [Phytophthora fragariae]